MPRSLVLLASVLVACSTASSSVARSGSSPADDSLRSDSTRIQAGRTRWLLQPSEALDALCFANILIGDPFYVDRGYRSDFDRFHGRAGPEELKALGHLAQRLRQAGKVIPGRLGLVFSASKAKTLDDLVALLRDDAAFFELRRSFLASPFGAGSDFADIEDVRGDLSTILAFLKREGFADYWAATALPRIREFVARSAAELGRYDVVGADERVLGRHLEVDELTVFALAYVKPHGIRVTGWRFLTDISYPLEVTVRTALHELLHPPFLPGSPGERALQRLAKDPFFQRLVREHDPRFGYTTTAGLLEEDADTAIHIFNSVHLGVLADPVRYFREHDDGIHVLAFLLYRALEKEDFSRWATYDDFVVRLVGSGALAPGKLEQSFLQDPEHYPIGAFKPR